MATRADYRDHPVAEVIAEHGVRDAIQMKHVGSVLYTYRCTLWCRHCCFNSGPHRPPVHPSIEDGLSYLEQLHATDRVIHIAGGEALMYFDEVLELCRAANERGIAPHFIETNTTWCVDDDTTASRLTALRDAGVQGLLVSADPFHQAECPAERYRRCYAAACMVFGGRNVAGAPLSLAEVQELERIAHDECRLIEYTLRSGACLTGRAGYELIRHFPERPIEDLAGDSMWHGPESGMTCRKEFEPEEMWEIHIDPYGNFQTCCGIILGNAKARTLPDLMAEGFTADPLVAAVHRDGPRGLLPFAVERGYQPRERYAQKCAMCWELRLFLRPHFPETFGPAEVYDP
jgi:hypothetical protein